MTSFYYDLEQRFATCPLPVIPDSDPCLKMKMTYPAGIEGCGSVPRTLINKIAEHQVAARVYSDQALAKAAERSASLRDARKARIKLAYIEEQNFDGSSDWSDEYDTQLDRAEANSARLAGELKILTDTVRRIQLFVDANVEMAADIGPEYRSPKQEPMTSSRLSTGRTFPRSWCDMIV